MTQMKMGQEAVAESRTRTNSEFTSTLRPHVLCLRAQSANVFSKSRAFIEDSEDEMADDDQEPAQDGQQSDEDNNGRRQDRASASASRSRSRSASRSRSRSRRVSGTGTPTAREEAADSTGKPDQAVARGDGENEVMAETPAVVIESEGQPMDTDNEEAAGMEIDL
jgi:hypothetical protein